MTAAPALLTEENSRLVPLVCPVCGRHVGASASCHLAVETPAGSLLVSTGYARFLCLCGALCQTRRSERTGRLYLVRMWPRRTTPNRWGRGGSGNGGRRG